MKPIGSLSLSSLTLGLLLAASCAPVDAMPNTSESNTAQEISAETFSLPWEPGRAYWVFQGEYGVIPGETRRGDHSIASMNHAIDFGLPMDTPVLAAREGTVRYTKGDVQPSDPCYNGGGESCANSENYVVIDHSDGTETLYMHFSRVWVHPGDSVHRGQELGRSGSTGWSSGPHLHVQRQQPCGTWFCDSIPLRYDVVGIPQPGTMPVASARSNERCWSDALDRFVSDACVQNPTSQDWHECVSGAWQGVDSCSDGVPVYGFCQDDSGTWHPERSCAPVQGAWKQCDQFGQWQDGVSNLAGVLGGPIGVCAD